MFGELPDLPESYIPDDDRHLITQESLPSAVRYERKLARREMITALQKQALTELIKELPPPDTDLYIIGNGSGGTYGKRANPDVFEFGHFIPVMIDMLGGKADALYISTWTMNRNHANNILSAYDAGKVTTIGILTDPYFITRESHFANALVDGLRKRGQRLKAFKNHTKVIAIGAPSGCVVVTGSANLSAQPRAENWILSTSPELYAWWRDSFFEVMLNAD